MSHTPFPHISEFNPFFSSSSAPRGWRASETWHPRLDSSLRSDRSCRNSPTSSRKVPMQFPRSSRKFQRNLPRRCEARRRRRSRLSTTTAFRHSSRGRYIKVSHPLSIRLLPSQLLHTQLFRCVTRPRPPPFSVTILRRAARGCRALSWRAPHKGGCAGGGRGDGWRWRHLGCPHCRHFIARQPRGGRRQVS